MNKPKNKVASWHLVTDWSQPVSVIASEAGCGESSVRRELDRRGMPRKVKQVDWSLVTDWNQSIPAIAREAKCGMNTAWKKKRQLNIAPNPRTTRVDWDRIDLNISDEELAKRFRMRRQYASKTGGQRLMPGASWDLPLEQDSFARACIAVAAENHGLDVSTIAKLMGITEPHADAILCRGIAKIRNSGVDWERSPSQA